MAPKKWVMIENNPEVMNQLAARLGLSPDLTFYDIYSLDEADLAHVPRPALALLVIIPMTPAWAADRQAEDATMADRYGGSGPDEPVIWFEQTIGNACGSIGLLHCAVNGPAADHVVPDSDLDGLRAEAVPLGVDARAALLHDSEAFEAAHASVVGLGDTPVPVADEGHRGQHFVAYVKAGAGRRLWELEGSRRGPIDRGGLADDEDVLSPRALELGLKRIMGVEQAAGGRDLRFSCIALARKS